VLERNHGQCGTRGRATFVAFFSAGAGTRLRFVVDRENSVADREPLFHRKVHHCARGFTRYDLEMVSLAADHATQSNYAVVGRAAAARGVDRYRDGGGYFERARNRDAIVACARIVEHAGRAA
jgi:hypothetical protein